MKRIALIGMPNTGKSTLFNRISGASARVGNWPGITVDLMSAKILLGGHIVELIDLPGLYDLHGYSDDEQVVRDFLATNAVDLVMITLNGSQIDRQLSLALQIRELGLPAILMLNMVDESRRNGITIDTPVLSRQLNMPVMQISAKHGEGTAEALRLAAKHLDQQTGTVSPEQISQLLHEDHRLVEEMEALVKDTVHIPAQLNDQLTARIDHLLLHPWFGIPIFFAAMLLLFQFIFTAGAPLQDGVAWLLDT
ncbi:MAG TPA: FeoB small GTPase domain-containing protein, partial [Methylophilaceae bacterium]|nr:FeoB small GTPase domain-containing protein [Methylophilaceae bacterium]